MRSIKPILMLQELLTNNYLIGLFVFAGAFFMVYFIIPKVIWVVTSRDLIDHPNERSAHKISTPTMAGYSFFLSMAMVVFFLKSWDVDDIGINIIAGLSLVLTVGLKDDLVLSTPRAKLIGEITAFLFVLSNAQIQIGSLDNFLGVQTLPLWLSITLSVLILTTIINAYNLIDGIDGLAATVGVVVFSIYALLFFVADFLFYGFVCLGLIGSLISYYRFNVSGTNKIFMGDTGSLIIGFFLGIMTIKFLSIDMSLVTNFYFLSENKLIIIAAILWVPLFDMFRVIGIRLLQGKSPLYPDRNHIHHLLIDSGMSPFTVTMLLGFFNVVLVMVVVLLSARFNSVLMLGFIALVFVALLGGFRYLKKQNEKKSKMILEE